MGRFGGGGGWRVYSTTTIWWLTAIFAQMMQNTIEQTQNISRGSLSACIIPNQSKEHDSINLHISFRVCKLLCGLRKPHNNKVVNKLYLIHKCSCNIIFKGSIMYNYLEN